MKRFLCMLLTTVFLFVSIAYAETAFDASVYSLTELMEIRAIVDEQIAELATIPSAELLPGKYVAGDDLAAGSYIIHGLMDKGPDGYTPQVLIANSMNDIEYSDYLCYEYMKNNEKWYVNVSSENVIEVRSGTVSIEPAPLLNCSLSLTDSTDDNTQVTSTLVPGFYTAGKDIAAGSYILLGLMDKGPDGYTPQVLIANSMDDISYSEYIEYEYMKKDEVWRIQLDIGNVLEVRSGDVCVQEVVPLAYAPSEEEKQQLAEAEAITEPEASENAAEKIPVVKGTYTVGKDIDAGSYEIILTDCKQSTVVATFASSSNLSSYTSWDSANNLAKYSKAAVYVKKDVPVHISLENGDLLYIANGQGYLVESTPNSIIKGVYIVGTDVQPGAHTITLSDIHNSAVVATFSNANDMLSYITWDSANNLKEYGKTAIYAKADIPFHIYLEQGDYLYIAEGTGTIADAQDGVLIKGVYSIGKDIEAGSYLITLDDFHNYATVATFANCSDLVSYISWDSANNLKEYSTASISVKKGEQFHLTLVDGEYLYISDGTGSYQLTGGATKSEAVEPTAAITETPATSVNEVEATQTPSPTEAPKEQENSASNTNTEPVTDEKSSNTHAPELSGKTAHIEAGKYVGGDDIPAGKYILTCKTDSKASGIVWLATDTDNLDEEYPSLLYEFISKNEERYFYLNIGDGYILNCPFACDLTVINSVEFENGTARIEAGRYIIGNGKDLPAGKYILVCNTGDKDSGIVWLAKDTDNLKKDYPSLLYEFISKNTEKKFYLNLRENYILCCPFACTLIECNSLEFENDSVTIEAGTYIFGDDLPAGKYILKCNTISKDSGIIWLATDTDDLSQNYPSLLYEFVSDGSEETFSINVKDGYILNCPFGCTLTISKGVNFE